MKKSNSLKTVMTIISITVIIIIVWFIFWNSNNEKEITEETNIINTESVIVEEESNKAQVDTKEEVLENNNYDTDTVNASKDKQKIATDKVLFDYPISHIITFNDKVIFTTLYKELPNEVDNNWNELKCFEYFSIEFWKNQKLCYVETSDTIFEVEELNFNW